MIAMYSHKFQYKECFKVGMDIAMYVMTKATDELGGPGYVDP